MIKEIQLRVVPQVAYSEQNISEYVSREYGIDRRTIKHLRILKRSIDARQRQIYVNLSVRVYINELPSDELFTPIDYPDVSGGAPVIVVGAGPAGLFAALQLIELGLRPIVIERGKDVRERKKDLARISHEQRVDPESNYCFGEGGAGAYSDGKLFTRSKKRGDTDKVLNIFCQFGAGQGILVDVHPHIGTDKLPGIIESMRLQILRSGGEVHFKTKMTRLLINNKCRVEGVECVCGERTSTFRADAVILATGHSARDVYRYLADIPRMGNIFGLSDARQIVEAKGIAVGVRVEHPSELIDRLQYHSPKGRGEYLPPAEYSFVTQVRGCGVYSFCMCPGGFIIPSATENDQIVVNGMSPSNRGGRWSNSGIVVEVAASTIEDSMENLLGESYKNEAHSASIQDDPLAVLSYQEHLERLCHQQSATVPSSLSPSATVPSSATVPDGSLQGKASQVPSAPSGVMPRHTQQAPAQRLADFTRGQLSYDLPRSSYAPGIFSSPLHFWLPKDISSRLQEGFIRFDAQRRGFVTNEAIIIGVETRTSAPVRITRSNETLQHISIRGLFPAGEGAGYAGGIVSAAVDGIRAANMAAELVQSMNISGN